MEKRLKEKSMKLLYGSSAFLGIAVVVVITAFLLSMGLPSMFEIGIFEFLFGTTWNPANNEFGIFPMIVNTIIVTAFSGLIGVIIGRFTAIFICYFVGAKLKKILMQLVQLLAGIPSVIFGFFGVQVLVPLFSTLSSSGIGYGVMTSSIILGIMVLPTVISISVSSLENADKFHIEGALALGASKEQSIYNVAVPSAKTGLMSAAILGIGRAVGETMAIVMVSGNIPEFATSFFQGIRTLTGNIVLEMSYAEGLHEGALVATGVVLFVMILCVTVGLNIYKTRSGKMKKGKKIVIDKCTESTSPQYVLSRTKEKAIKAFSLGCTSVTMMSLVGIVLFILVMGLPHLSFDFVFGAFEYGGAITLLPSIVTTLMLIGLTVMMSVPIGVMTAIFLCEYTKNDSQFVKLVRMSIETLAGIPSIIFGLFGMMFFCELMGMGYSIMAGALTLTLMNLPTIIRTTEQSILEVPQSLREASYALGVGKTTTIFRIVLPSAMGGILNGIILSIGRIVSESAVVLFTVGSTKSMPTSPMSSGISLAVYMYILAGEGLHVNEAYGAAVVLLVIVLMTNLASHFIKNFAQRKNSKM